MTASGVADEYGLLERSTQNIGMQCYLLLPEILGCQVMDLLPDALLTSGEEALARDFEDGHCRRRIAELMDMVHA